MKLLNSQTARKLFGIAKPVLTIVIVLTLIHYSGLIMGVVLGTDDEASAKGRLFNYNFNIKDLAGNEIDAKSLKNKVIFLNLWATWCGPCRKEMPSIQELYSKVDHEKIAFVMLSLDTEADHQKIVKYIADKGFSFPVYETSGALPGQLQVSVIPTTFIIGKDGKIALKKTGMEDYDTEHFGKLLEDLSLK
jgi:thiol-disulfide isomerase/thioredoxin